MSQAQPDFSNKLVDALRHLPGEIFAVLDGAHVDGAAAQLKARKLIGRPLFLEAGGKSSIDTGPHLVSVPNPYALEQLQELVAGKPALMFWSWQHGAETLYRHLRTINLVEIPDEERGTGYETVVFRHASPNVMASVLPLLTPAQVSRLLGSSAGLTFDAPDFGGVKLLPRPDGLPQMPRGYLRFEKEQVEKMGETQMVRSRRRIGRYLRGVAPEHTRGLSDTELNAAVLQAERTGREIGLKSEQAFGRWSYLNIITRGAVLEQDGVRKYLTDGMHTPDEKVNLLLRSLGLAYKHLERGQAR